MTGRFLTPEEHQAVTMLALRHPQQVEQAYAQNLPFSAVGLDVPSTLGEPGTQRDLWQSPLPVLSGQQATEYERDPDTGRYLTAEEQRYVAHLSERFPEKVQAAYEQNRPFAAVGLEVPETLGEIGTQRNPWRPTIRPGYPANPIEYDPGHWPREPP
ncbi:hypothetical protein [Halorientalis pallida]|uniref:Uncharacterized protein n=1 Tax=Halorientalis pallida TaxID=2479928 RepID=A0A498L2C0_9EURY|nr:hypothetical protein [Halorientalis pallida]RXK50286.1 hypothetical protein EAF64_06915 [Halorientalis pallida]